MQSPPGPETVFDGVPYLYFGGTSYLGLASHPEVIEAGCAALRRFGVHSATARSRWGTNPSLLDCEAQAAKFFRTDDAFHFASGYSTNHILLPAVLAGVERVVVDSEAHYCVREAAQLANVPVVTLPSPDPEALAQAAKGVRRVLLMADAVSPVMGTLAPVADYVRVLRRCEQAVLMLDDAHGFGVLGEYGRGLFDELGLWDSVNRETSESSVRLCVGGTLSKALGGFGGLIPGAAAFLERVRQSSHHFDSASAPPSAVTGASAAALAIAQREPERRARLRANARQLRAGLRGLGLSVPEGVTANLGLAIGDAAHMQRLHTELRSRGILLPYIPAYSGTPASGVLRFAVFATHSSDQIETLVSALAALL